MKAIIQAVFNTNLKSVRADLMRQPVSLKESKLEVASPRKQSRPNGWTTLKSSDRNVAGRLKIEWDSRSAILTCRATTKINENPHEIISAFVGFLLKWYEDELLTISIIGR